MSQFAEQTLDAEHRSRIGAALDRPFPKQIGNGMPDLDRMTRLVYSAHPPQPRG